MTRSRSPLSIRSRRGMAYVATLGIILVATVLGLAFVATVGTHTALSESRNGAMQSQYLAETAAHHALWRFEHEPGFPDDESVYYMHDLAGGQYGYKMRRPAPATFAAVATVGIADGHIARQSYVSFLQPRAQLLAYAFGVDGLPEYRRLFGVNWSAPGDTVDYLTAPVRWLELELSSTGEQAVMATLNDDDHIQLAVWEGGTWGNGLTFTTAGNRECKCFDVAFESLSGGALVVGRYDDTSQVRYDCWTGLYWDPPTPALAFSTGSGAPTYVVMDSSPKSDEILVGTACSNSTLTLHRWNGTVFEYVGRCELSTNTSDYGCFDLAHEQQSGEAMVVWARTASDAVQYATFSGRAQLSSGSLPTFGYDDIRLVRLAADPASDHLVLAAVLKTGELHVAIWNGSAWSDAALVETRVKYADQQVFDVAWEAAGGEAIVAWVPNSASEVPRYITWSPGSSLADCIPADAPGCPATIELLRLSPVTESDDVLLLASSEEGELRGGYWTGSEFQGTTAELLGFQTVDIKTLFFDAAGVSHAVSESATEIGGVAKNTPPSVNAGPDQEIRLGEAATLVGVVGDDGLPDPPGAVTSTWSVVGGPGDVILEDPATPSTNARFSRGGVYLLRLTVADGELTATDEVVVTVVTYFETFATWTVGTSAAWTTVDLSGSPYFVPADAVVEVAIMNSNTDAEELGGVRSTGATAGRGRAIHEAEAGGVDVMVMHVQVDGGSRIECFAGDRTKVEFALLGYWARGTYVDDWRSFLLISGSTWVSVPLSLFGVGAGQVAEIVICNGASSSEALNSIRPQGSTLEGRTLELHEAEGGGEDMATLFVPAGADADAIAEFWSDSQSKVTFIVSGYWPDPPGTYVAAGEDLGSASLDSTWETIDLSAHGVPAGAVVQIGLANLQYDSENRIGVRAVGSAVERTLDLHEAEPSSGDYATMHVQTGAIPAIEVFQERAGDAHRFYLFGWWE